MSTTKPKKALILEPNEVNLFIENLNNNVLKKKRNFTKNLNDGYDFDVKGAFEFHITVRIKNKQDVDKFVNYCHEIGVKPIFIELPYGEEIKQLMTSKYITGTYPNVLKPVYDIAYKIRSKGFEILRVKIESLACNKGVPLENKHIMYEPQGRYFEFHFKIKLQNETEKLKLVQLGKKFNAHTSRNAFKKFENGSFTNFLTMRAFNKGRHDALKEFYNLKNTLISNDFEVLGHEQEYVVYDSNLCLDDGWVKKEKTNKYINFMHDNAFHLASVLFFASSIYYLFS